MKSMGSAPEIEIRPATSADAEAILNCLAAAFAPYRDQYAPAAFADTTLDSETIHLRMQQMHVLVATVAGCVIGTVAGVAHDKEGHLRGMAVLPEWHGRGIAGKLLAAIEEYLRSRECLCIALDTTRPLETAMSFYEKNGYRRSGKVSDFFGMALIEYSKPL
jgi:ribosomal protein S18 acetylase RimI-like enzyme